MRALRSPLVLLGVTVLVVLFVVAVFAPLIAPYDPKAASGPSLERPSVEHLLGTDDIGQDIFSLLVWGTRQSLIVGIGAATLAIVTGVLVGVVAGLIGGLVDTLAMRVVDVALALPRLPLLVLIAALAGVNRVVLVLVIGLVTWPETARIVRSQTLALRDRGFVDSARGFGGGLAYVVRRHLVPALGPILVAGFVTTAGQAVLMEAGLAFLGLADPTAVSWGLVLNRALVFPGLYFTSLWVWWVLPAGFAIAMTVLGLTFLGVGLEPLLNPRLTTTR
ncbi:MAG: ABC transporter permease [Acidimicrobiia bacterium]|nr:ABC transporter permease [Acidimicrobiia bacterium]